eukprot:c12314_g1_i1.p1 GENE.c12314_g1_i1~~c12314_g1_i1.p1  ORF type:complete len:341 (-),score=50.77 c12314_g1_i1:108-1130(-)
MFYAERGEWDPASGEFKRTTLYEFSGKEPSPFTSISVAFWWVLVTFSTVGYGDLIPSTSAGQIVGVATMYTGIILVAMPISIMGINVGVVYFEEQVKRRRKDRVQHTGAMILKNILTGNRLILKRRAWNTWKEHAVSRREQTILRNLKLQIEEHRRSLHRPRLVRSLSDNAMRPDSTYPDPVVPLTSPVQEKKLKRVRRRSLAAGSDHSESALPTERSEYALSDGEGEVHYLGASTSRSAQWLNSHVTTPDKPSLPALVDAPMVVDQDAAQLHKDAQELRARVQQLTTKLARMTLAAKRYRAISGRMSDVPSDHLRTDFTTSTTVPEMHDAHDAHDISFS